MVAAQMYGATIQSQPSPSAARAAEEKIDQGQDGDAERRASQGDAHGLH
jgi:hypothetical protein